MATPLSTKPRSRVRYQYAHWHLGVIALVVIGVGVLLVGGRMLARASFVPRVEVVNDSEYAVDLDVTSGAHDGWMGVGIAKPHTTTTFEDVYDQGDTWILRYGVQGRSIEVTVPRDEFAAWGMAAARARWPGRATPRSGGVADTDSDSDSNGALSRAGAHAPARFGRVRACTGRSE